MSVHGKQDSIPYKPQGPSFTAFSQDQEQNFALHSLVGEAHIPADISKRKTQPLGEKAETHPCVQPSFA